MGAAEPAGNDPASRIPVVASLFDETALATWLNAEFDIGGLAECRLVSRSVNDTFRVTSPRGTYYLRVSPRALRTRREVEAELAFIGALHEQGVAVARPIPRRDGSIVSTLVAPEGERQAVLFEAAPGSHVRDIRVDHSRAYGRLAARLHDGADAATAATLDRELGSGFLLDEPLAAIHDRFGDTNGVAYLESIAARVRTALARLPRTPPDFGLCHGDLHPANVHFDDLGAPTVFDFDLAGAGWRVYDLTTFLANAFGERRARRWRDSRWRAFLGGYREIRALHPEALDAVPLFLVTRQFLIMGFDCRPQSSWPVEWLDDRYLKDMIAPIRSWEAEHPILRD